MHHAHARCVGLQQGSLNVLLEGMPCVLPTKRPLSLYIYIYIYIAVCLNWHHN